jgi:eukaryotic-like serine/threonine-protein kinase
MEPLYDLVREMHRRSLWQVLGIFLAASWGVLQVVELLTETAGLPDWTPTMALVLLMLGLPVCLATAFVQEGMPGSDRGAPSDLADDGDASSEVAGADSSKDPAPNLAPGTGSLDRPSTRPSRTGRLLTWRNAILGGVGAFALLGFSLVAYFVMWTTGLGPVGSLVAQGVIEEGERVVLADFDDSTGEGLGAVVTEALRVDLTSAAVLRPVERASLAPALERMQLEPGTAISANLAREVAVREGIGAVIDGGVARAGTGYVITASLTEASSGRVLATFRVSANGPDEVIASIDKLSQNVREKSGESLRNIRSGEPLERVTTRSLEALRLYSEAQALFGTTQGERVIDLLRQAVEIDPEFAMAWRKLSSAYNNSLRFDLMAEAGRRAYEHRDRLTERERYLTEATYYNTVLDDQARTIAAYQAVLRSDPDNATALNNISNSFNRVGELEEANTMLRRAVDGPGRTITAYSNLVLSEIALGRYETAADVLRDFEAAFPDSDALPIARFHVALMNGATSQAEAVARTGLEDPGLSPIDRSEGAMWLAKIAYREGRLADARELTVQSARMAGQDSPTLEGLRYTMGAYREATLGTEEAARDFLERASATGALSLLPVGFTEFVARIAAVAGDPERARAILADAERARPEEFAELGPTSAEVWIRLASGDTDGLEAELVRRMTEQGCTGASCWELERAQTAAETGDLDTAIALFEQVASRGSTLWPLVGIDDLYATSRLAPLYEQVGDTARALDAYRSLITKWENGDPVVRERVEGYRARVRALGG